MNAKLAKVAISDVLRARLQERGLEFHANSNISEVIESPKELELLVQNVEDRMQDLLDALVIDTENDHNSQGTAHRVAKMLVHELYAGRYYPEPDVTDFPNYKQFDQTYFLGPLQCNSTCSHHHVPIIGHAWVGILPSKETRLVGISKVPRIVRWFCNRPQIQEEMSQNIADYLFNRIKPEALAVTVKSVHYCMRLRGVKDPDSCMITQAFKGTMVQDDALRTEYLAMLAGMRFNDPTLL